MARQPLRVVRSSEAAFANYTGVSGEPGYATDSQRPRMMTGTVPGGLPLVTDQDILPVGTVAAMIGIPSIRCRGVRTAIGYRFPFDNGTNVWDWDPASTRAHAEPYCLQPADQLGVAGTPGRWIWRLPPSSEPIDIRRLGCRYGTDAPDIALDNSARRQAFANESDRRYMAGEGQMTLALPGVAYTLAATVTSVYGFGIIGVTAEKSVFRRVTDYGHTFVFGSATTGGVQGLRFSRFSILHPIGGLVNGLYDPSPSISGAIAQSSCHFVLYNCSNSVIDNVHTENLSEGWRVFGGSRNMWTQCSVIGYWDGTSAANNQMYAGWRFLDDGASRGHPQTTTLLNCSVGGYTKVIAAKTYTSGTKTRTITNFIQNIGPFFGILVESCEGVSWDGGYIGACFYSGVRLQIGTAPLVYFSLGGSAYVDGCGIAQFSIARPANINASAFSVDIGRGVQFVGADNTERGLFVEWDGVTAFPVVRELRCAAWFRGHLYTPISIQAAQGFDLSDARLYGWNRVAIGSEDVAKGSALFIGGITANGTIRGVTYGGGLGGEEIDPTYAPGAARPDGTYAANQNAYGPSFQQTPASMRILTEANTIPAWNVKAAGLNGPALAT